jgi:uncharacterized protein (TIGR02285 family)
MRMLRLLLLLATVVSTVLCLGSVARAQDSREITWLAMEFPPFFIQEGDQADRGIADELTRILQENMPEWRHREEVANTAQIVVRLRAGEHVCSAAYIRTPQRERFMEFSIPDLVLPPNGITIRRADIGRFGGGEPVSLATLLDDPSLRLGVAQGRSYGKEIDAIIERHKQDRHVYSRLGEDIYATLFDMLVRRGVDYIVGYPYEASFHARRRGKEGEIVSLPVRENPEMILAHVVCPKTDWGRQAITDIDEVLRRVRLTPEYRALVERWLDPELRQAYREAYETELGLPATE